MKRWLVLFSIVIMTAGCGSLNRHISSTQLSASDMKYAKLLDKYSSVNMNIDTESTSFSTEQNANKAFCVPPIFYWRSFGCDQGYGIFRDDNETYGAMRIFALWPILSTMKGSIYDEDGKAFVKMSGGTLAPLIGVMKGKDEKESVRMNGFTLLPLPIPLLGSANLYSQQSVKQNGRTKTNFSLFKVPILGNCLATGENARFLWIPL